MKLNVVFIVSVGVIFMMLSQTSLSYDFLRTKSLEVFAYGTNQAFPESIERISDVQSISDGAQRLLDLEQEVHAATDLVDGLIQNQVQLLSRVENLL